MLRIVESCWVLSLLLVLVCSGCNKSEEMGCKSDAECGESGLCRKGTCVELKKAGESCRRNQECTAGFVCLEDKCLKLGKAGESCKDGAQCVEGLVCRNEACFALMRVGEACRKDGECLEGLICYEGRCFAPRARGNPCERDGQCVSGLICYARKCIEPKRDGEACADSKACAVGLVCFKDKCLPVELAKGEVRLARAGLATMKEVEGLCLERERLLKDAEELHSKARAIAAEALAINALLVEKVDQFVQAEESGPEDKRPTPDFCDQGLRSALRTGLEQTAGIELPASAR